MALCVKEIILASTSPRRREILSQIGVPFRVQSVPIDESLPENSISSLEFFKSWPQELASRKALAVSHLEQATPVLGFDTLVFSSSGILGKPKNADEALTMLQQLNGQTHTVISGVALALGGKILGAKTAETSVTFRKLSDRELAEYVQSGEPLDKAGAYGIQGLGAKLVESIGGCYYNVVGLPIAKTLDLLKECEVLYVRNK